MFYVCFVLHRLIQDLFIFWVQNSDSSTKVLVHLPLWEQLIHVTHCPNCSTPTASTRCRHTHSPVPVALPRRLAPSSMLKTLGSLTLVTPSHPRQRHTWCLASWIPHCWMCCFPSFYVSALLLCPVNLTLISLSFLHIQWPKHHFHIPFLTSRQTKHHTWTSRPHLCPWNNPCFPFKYDCQTLLSLHCQVGLSPADTLPFPLFPLLLTNIHSILVAIASADSAPPYK